MDLDQTQAIYDITEEDEDRIEEERTQAKKKEVIFKFDFRRNFCVYMKMQTVDVVKFTHIIIIQSSQAY